MRYLRFLMFVFAASSAAGSALAFGPLHFGGGGGGGGDAVHNFKASLDGASEQPPNHSRGSGVATATLNITTKELTWRVTYSGLKSVEMAGIHGPANAGQNAPIVIRFTGKLTSPIAGNETFQPSIR